MRLNVVNCSRRQGMECLDGHYGGRPSNGVCGICPHRQAIHPDRTATYDVEYLTAPQAAPEPPPAAATDQTAATPTEATDAAQNVTVQPSPMANVPVRRKPCGSCSRARVKDTGSRS